MTIREYCKDLTADANEKRLIIVDAQTHAVLADTKMIILQNSKTRRDELCIMTYPEYMDCEIIDAIDSQIAITFIIEPILLNEHLPIRIALCSVSNS